MPSPTFTADGREVPFEPGDSLLSALLKAGIHPTGGGCLCLGGDCSHCLATVDGVAYTRTCAKPAQAGARVERQHLHGQAPPLPERTPTAGFAPSENLHCDVVVIGQGPAGRAEAEAARARGLEVVTLDSAQGEEAVGVYPGPVVLARTPRGTLRVWPRHEIVVATGAAELQPVAPGTHLQGLLTARAAQALHAQGLALVQVVALGTPPAGVPCQSEPGECVRLEGESRVEAVVLRDEAGNERRVACDTVVFGLGLSPRDTLMRMGRGLKLHGREAVRGVGDAASPGDVPPCPREGVVCACSRVTVADLELVYSHGFRELELVKRATLAGTGSCQGVACLPHVRSFLAALQGALPAPFTARPLSRPTTVAEAAAGVHPRATPRTALDAEHRRLGARMERLGGWWRPWTYGNTEAERRAVREAVSLGDVSTLGKMRVFGPGAPALVAHLYPSRVEDLATGRVRYALLLDERGAVLDDGMVARLGPESFYLTTSSGGASFTELWMRDWAEALGLEVQLLAQTMSFGAINVTGPRAAELLARAGLAELPRYLGFTEGTVAGIPCRVLRLSFTGELSYELHHSAGDSVTLWRRLLALGEPLGARPHGLEALFALRLEKGHLLIGQDTGFDSTPRRLHHEWAVDLTKADFIGKMAVERTNKIALDRQLVGFEADGPPPVEGTVILAPTADGSERYAGQVTSATFSNALGKTVLLGWLELADGRLPDEVSIAGRPARRVPRPFYDPEGLRTRVRLPRLAAETRSWTAETVSSLGLGRLSRLEATRVAAKESVLSGLKLHPRGPVLPLAPDEVLVLGAMSRDEIDAPGALVEREDGFAGLWLPADEALAFLRRECAWPLPAARPAFAQGMVAGLPVKLWLEAERVLLVVAAPFAHELSERLS